MRWGMVSQQPGGLSDAQFAQDPRQSLRSRNWFNLDWTTAALIANVHISTTARLNVKVFGVQGDRNSVGYFPGGGITVADTVNAATLAYNPRNLDIDLYRNYGMEARFIGDYVIGGLQNTVSTGVRLYQGNTDRFRGGGMGTTGTGLDLTRTTDAWSQGIDFNSRNAAIFV